MTTIALKDNILAADRQVTNGGTIVGHITKIGVTMAQGRTGSFRYALLGKEAHARQLLHWFITDGNPLSQPAAPEGCLLAIDSNGGGVLYDEGFACQMPHAPFHAWGSGMDVALGAMAMGATAQKAVEIASQFNYGTGGGFDVLPHYENSY